MKKGGHTVFAGQVVQEVAPATVLYCPGGHTVQDPEFGDLEYVPLI